MCRGNRNTRFSSYHYKYELPLLLYLLLLETLKSASYVRNFRRSWVKSIMKFKSCHISVSHSRTKQRAARDLGDMGPGEKKRRALANCNRSSSIPERQPLPPLFKYLCDSHAEGTASKHRRLRQLHRNKSVETTIPRHAYFPSMKAHIFDAICC